MNDGKKPPEDLKQRTKAFALRIIRLFAALPKSIEAQVIGKQSATGGKVNQPRAHEKRQWPVLADQPKASIQIIGPTGFASIADFILPPSSFRKKRGAADAAES